MELNNVLESKTIEQIKHYYKEAKVEWKEFKYKAKDIRIKEMVDKSNLDIEAFQTTNESIKKKLLKRIQKEQ